MFIILIGHFPLRKLVYRVLPLPRSMYQYVYDFGTISGKIEEEYISKIVGNQVHAHNIYCDGFMNFSVIAF